MIYLAYSLSLSIGANGPGPRAVFWLQGCSLRCPGCCNPEFQGKKAPTASTMLWIRMRELILKWSKEHSLRGVTLTGGEPMDQAVDLAKVFRGWGSLPLRSGCLDLLIFTGYTREEIGVEENTSRAKLWRAADIVVSGRYDETQKIRDPKGLLASRNQRVYFPTGRLGPNDLEGLPVGEVIIDGAGNAVLTGMSPGVLD